MHGAYMDHFNHTYYLYRILLEQIDSPTRGARDFLEDRWSIDRFQYKMIGDMLSEITHAASMEENKWRYIDAFIQDALPQIARKEFPYWIKEQTVSYDTLVAYRNFASWTERDTLSVDHCLEKNSFPKTDTFPDKNYIPLLWGYSLYTGRYEDWYNNPKWFEWHIHEIDQKYIEEAYLRNYKQYMDTTNQDELYEYALICLGYFFRSKHIFAEQEGLDILWKMIRHTDSKMAKIALIDYYQNKIFNIGMAGGLKKQFKIGKETNTAKKKQATYHVSTCLETLFCFTDAEKSNPLLKIECIEKKVTK